MTIDQDKLTGFLHKFVGDLGATMAAGNLVGSWLPALDGVEAKLNTGAKVADVGCSHGASTTLMARAFPNSSFTGLTITRSRSSSRASGSRKRIAEADLGGRVRFDVAAARPSTAARMTW